MLQSNVPLSATFTLLLSLAALSCATTTGPLNPCALLTPADIGQRPVETKASGNDCFYRLEPFVDSVSLSAVPHARELWERMEKRDEKGEEKEESHVREIKGLGRDALWSTLPVGSTLYVLQGETMLRISVGGKMD